MDQYLQYIFGENNIIFQVLLCFLGVNYLLQLFLAIYRKEISYQFALQALLKKLAIFLVIAIAHQTDRVVGDENMVRDGTAFFYLANELLTMIETLMQLGIKVPKVLKNLVEVFKTNAGENHEKK
ncbi:phage holin family protein [Listeria kieliensis]